jgi:hypothetical protein
VGYLETLHNGAYKYELKLESGGVNSDYKDKSWSLKMLILTSTETGLIFQLTEGQQFAMKVSSFLL